MKKILVPCDFSRPAINAFRYALSIAESSNSVIHLLHVIELPVIADPILVSVTEYEVVMKKEMEDYAQKKFSALLAKHNVANASVVPVVKFGLVISTIVDYINKGKFDVVFMGSHGASGLREYLIGSNVEKVVRFSSAPVLVVKDFRKAPVKDIVVPFSDDVETSEEFVSKLKDLQKFYNAHLHVVWINTPGNFTTDLTSRKRLLEFVERNKLKSSTIYTFNALNEMEGILQFGDMMSANMIAMATHGRKGISHLYYGSIAEDVINHAPNLIWTYAIRNHEKIQVDEKLEEHHYQ